MRQLIDSMIESLKRQSCEHMATLKKLYETDWIRDRKNFNYLTERLIILAEKYACCVREFGFKTYAVNRNVVYDKAAEMQGIEICKEGNKIIIDLPFLLPGKKGKNVNFVGAPLKNQFDKIKEIEDLKIREKVVICIIHFYDNVNVKAKCYDYDNLESKRILDIITLYTLEDDSPKHCDVYQTAEFGDTNKTKIIVMPVNEFWTQHNPYFSGEFM